MDSRRGGAAPDSGPVKVYAVDPYWIVRIEIESTTQEYRCLTEAQARKLASTLTSAMRRWGRDPGRR